MNGFNDDNSLVYLTYQGDLLWERIFWIMTSCDLDVTYFPYDTCTCHVILEPAGYSTTFLSVSLNETKLSITKQDFIGNWFLWDHTRNKQVNESHNNTRHQGYFGFDFFFSRKSNFNLVAYVIPSMLTSLVMVLTFIIPVAVPERVTSSLVVFLVYI